MAAQNDVINVGTVTRSPGQESTFIQGSQLQDAPAVAGQSSVSNTFTHTSDAFFDVYTHWNAKTGDHWHDAFQDVGSTTFSDNTFTDVLFANDHAFNTVTHNFYSDGQQEVLHFNSHIPL